MSEPLLNEPLLNELRAARPTAPAGLRERVRTIAAQEPARAPFLARFEWRRLVVLAPATAVVALVAAGVIGLTRGDVDRSVNEAASSPEASTTLDAYAQRDAAKTNTLLPSAMPPVSAGEAAPGGGAGTVAPTPGQLQRYEAQLSLRVEDVEGLSDATKQAQQIAVQHGGSVASLRYDAPEAGTGAAQITLRIPTARVESALAELTQLGTIVGQSYGIDDLQQQADSLQTQIEQTQRRIAQILTQLESSTLSAEDRAVLQSRLTASRQKLTGLRDSLRSTTAEARTATIYLTLSTEEIEPGAVGGSSPLDDVKDVLAWEGIALLYFLVVAGPFLILGFLVWLALRLRRRHVTTRLLEQN